MRSPVKVDRRRGVGDPYGIRLLLNRERTTRKVHGYTVPCGDPRAIHVSMDSGDVNCLRCLEAMGLFVSSANLRKHQIYTRRHEC